ncbi:LacI family transcriptional regulator [Serratia sp. MYb239]|uniref:LacI family DNA-binding transcriptional regulator n=1 Tax=unclassified Serratia (in: enterobacteria) TaxID=2647522 RepID=UPI000CF6F856|nr:MULTISPECIES: LacI family DNA-binding transcriptional regulator [unclassified Serratia (in: enterobacteria)]AVJ17801.1 LacI family transcriptional regulator [Serratia sp. MYb239]MBU3892490.1 LacI family DNA-binding transcriptional regulator [Serratia rubidaea]CAE1146203.1 LacI family transcriptional regulator [Serratia sp. Tan611]
MAAKKVTLAEIARQAQVGIATVDRVLNNRAPVRPGTERKVLETARRLGFNLEQSHYRLVAGKSAVSLKMGFILLRESHSFYHLLSEALQQHAAPYHHSQQAPIFIHHDINAIEHTVAAIEQLSEQVDVIGLVALDNPLIRHAVEQAVARGVQVFTLFSDLSAPGRTGYIGMDNQKMGRTAAWAIDRMSRPDGDIGIIIGDNRFMCQETCEISFRSYLREQGKGRRVLEPVLGHEQQQQAFAVTERLLQQYPALTALYAPCGGVEGIIDALRQYGRQQEVMLVCHGPVQGGELALIDGSVDVMLSQRLDALAAAVIRTFVNAALQTPGGFISALQPFDIITKENL